MNMTTTDPAPASGQGIVSLRSRHSHGETLRLLTAAFADHGIKVFATIDQSAEAAAVGLALAPTTLILFGNPKAGTPLMQAQVLSGLDLPLKALVTESTPGEVMVSFNSAAYIMRRHALAPELLDKLLPAERLIASLVSP